MINIDSIKCLMFRNKKEFEEVFDIISKLEWLYKPFNPYDIDWVIGSHTGHDNSIVLYFENGVITGWDLVRDCGIKYYMVEDIVELRRFNNLKNNINFLINN